MTNDEIIEDFPELSIEAIQAALAFAADREESVKILAAAYSSNRSCSGFPV